MKEAKGDYKREHHGAPSIIQDPDDPQGADQIDFDINVPAMAVRLVMRREGKVLGFLCIDVDEADVLAKQLVDSAADCRKRAMERGGGDNLLSPSSSKLQ